MDSEKWHNPIHYEKGGTFEYESNGAIYVIGENVNDTTYARYVGKTEDLRDRMKKHESKNEENDGLKDLMQNRLDDVRVSYKMISDETRRSNLEHSIVSEYGLSSLYNEKMPEGKMIYNQELPF